MSSDYCDVELTVPLHKLSLEKLDLILEITRKMSNTFTLEIVSDLYLRVEALDTRYGFDRWAGLIGNPVFTGDDRICFELTSQGASMTEPPYMALFTQEASEVIFLDLAEGYGLSAAISFYYEEDGSHKLCPKDLAHFEKYSSFSRDFKSFMDKVTPEEVDPMSPVIQKIVKLIEEQ